jgi:alpha-glucosidase (family GH31 glycosyl hydrolase)
MMHYGPHSGLRSCFNAMLSAQAVGQNYMHCDIGGYISHSLFPSRTQSYLQRSLELSALGPIMRSHEGIRPDK